MMATLTKILELRYRISSQLYLALGGAVCLTFAASLVGWFSFDQVGDAQNRVNERSVPDLAAAFDVAQFSSALVADAAALPTATNPDEVAVVSDRIEEAHEAFEEQLAILENRADDSEKERFVRILAYSDTLLLNIGDIKEGISERFALEDQAEALQTELTTLRFQLDHIVAPARDAQLFYTVTGYRELGEPPSDEIAYRAEDELTRFHYLSELQSNVNIATQILASATTVSDPSLIEPWRERFESSVFHINRNLSRLSGTEIHSELTPLFSRLLELGQGDENSFELRSRQLELADLQVVLLANNHDIAVLLLDEMEFLVQTARNSAEVATEASDQAIFTGRTLLLAITGFSIVGAVLIAWLFVGRVLLHRIDMLSQWMRQMAGGDLEARAEIRGRDEVAEMAAALEVFRQHAIEIQRLNLVEELADELQGKNGELEQALTDLNTAQGQIVMREKLAALGELTAGVAHEIRNPLNFVKNFSEVSEELLEELKETLEESDDGRLNEEQQDLIEDIFGELGGNLERIRNHGDRANRIVQDMLMMSRESVGHHPTNINNLLDEHARLAYHSARAMDSNFQLDLQYDFDESMGEIVVNPQDLGRVFLNIVNNGCYATNEKRTTLTQGGSDYSPTLWLSTRRDDDRIYISIRDNGTGMPPEVIEKMFNPFFTTKPTDKGTGLGLSICNDIIRRHGGEILVESGPGEFTEMTIALPLHPPEPVADEPEDEVEQELVADAAEVGND